MACHQAEPEGRIAMAAITGTYHITTHSDLIRVLDLLVRTKGVLSVQVLPGRVIYQCQPWAKVDLLPDPGDPVTWADKLATADLRSYSADSLLEGVIYGWVELRKLHRYPTHLCAWDRESLFSELFPGASWPYELTFHDKLFGLEIVELKSEVDFTKGTVILCGGHVLDGGMNEINMGLVIRRPGRE